MSAEEVFTYVRIPADDAAPLEELSAVAVSCGDTLKELLKKSFAGGVLSNLDEMRAEHGALVDAKMNDLQAVAAKGSVESMPLVRPSKTTLPNPNVSTFLYYDEMGSLKDRPPNRRAYELAKQCGVDMETPLPGDVFIGRVCCDPGPISVSIAVNELDSASPWIQQAPAENAGWNDALKDFGSIAKTKSPGYKTDEELEAENLKRGWRYSQTVSDLELTVTIPAGTTKKGLTVVLARSHVRVTLKADPATPLVELKLYAPIAADESTWTIGSDANGPHVQLTLEKEDEQTWPSIESRSK